MKHVKNLEGFEVLRKLVDRIYTMLLVRKDDQYFTLNKMECDDFYTVQPLPEFELEIPLGQDDDDFGDDHARIHINPTKYIWNWRN